MDGEAVPVQSNLGVCTQPVSCIGLPIGVQFVAAPWREEDLLFRAARAATGPGVAGSPNPPE